MQVFRRFRIALVIATIALLATFSEARAQPEKPRLAVLIAFDQLRGDYLTRWQELFEDGGFRRLQKEGAWFQNCNYPYAVTVTGAGHASLGTGAVPAKHGIIGNDWFDRRAGVPVYCVASERYQRVPPSEGKKKAMGVSPGRLLQPTLADALKDATGGKGKVVSLSTKDRSAVLMVGTRPDACYWFDNGQFVTSTFYRDQPHSWVSDYNQSRPGDRWFGTDWTKLRPTLDYARYSGPDDVAGEGTGQGQGRTFPHPMSAGDKTPGDRYYRALYSSPFGNDLILELAKRAVNAEGLGSRDVPDLLCLSFSNNDPVGHVWGPDSQEVLDVTLRSDLIVRDLLTFLDAKVGKGRYVLALSADHGVCPLPEVSRSQGKDALRISADALRKQASDFLTATFKDQRESWFAPMQPADEAIYPWAYLNRPMLRERGLDASAVEQALADWLKKQPGIQTAYTRTQLEKGIDKDDRIGQMVARSYHPDRAGDVAVIVKPYTLVTPYLTGTTHGTPHDYDTHVPLLVFGAGVRPGVKIEAVTPQAAVVILAAALGIKAPAGAEAPLPAGILK